MRAFVDTSALLALGRQSDQYHLDAVQILRNHAGEGLRFVGTTLILGELHGHLLYQRGPAAAGLTLSKLLEDPIHEWVPVSADLVREAQSRWLARFEDQSISLVDAVSFEVMRTRRLTHAFAFDHHFEVVGYSLLR